MFVKGISSFKDRSDLKKVQKDKLGLGYRSTFAVPQGNAIRLMRPCDLHLACLWLSFILIQEVSVMANAFYLGC